MESKPVEKTDVRLMDAIKTLQSLAEVDETKFKILSVPRPARLKFDYTNYDNNESCDNSDEDYYDEQ